MKIQKIQQICRTQGEKISTTFRDKSRVEIEMSFGLEIISKLKKILTYFIIIFKKYNYISIEVLLRKKSQKNYSF